MKMPVSFPAGTVPLHDGPRYQAILRDFGSDILLVTFAERKEPKPADFFGVRLMEKEGLSYIAVRSLENDWYLGPEVDQVFAAIKEAIARVAPKRLILFGYSMGSFGAVRAANILNPDRIIIGGPIVSLDVNIERRWLSDYRELLPYYEERISEIIPWKKCYETVVIFDPDYEDAKHVSIIEEFANPHRLEIPDAGHFVLTYLRDSGVLGKIMRKLFEDDIDLVSVQRMIRSARKTNRSYLLTLANRLARRPKLQRRVLDYAQRSMPDDVDINLAKAAYLAQHGDLEGARAGIARMFAEKGDRIFGVPLAKTITAFASGGGSPDDIADVLALFRSNRPRSRETQLWYARFLRQIGAFDEAYAAHEQFMSGDTFEAHAHIERGLILEHRKQIHAARDSFRRAVELAPDFRPGHQHLRRVERVLLTLP
ncbi:hypothetical protein F8A10_10010 [Paracoccus kondratievae]|uniref:Tetratricopeptide repeat protein n=1 Tax=Paracoccus kondratievae TaxID=135740 RepID=A0AAD3RS78_9RHOB|nr:MULTISPECIES: tetratricopeptide repeat protein [Paracoccus]QFQ87741.1 hypothetical protein F8A10_10010 [Paracoccus kondratievae]GLK63178.1 hypothetical protein GCM10017635_06470 [Paracoccus kondratievae]